MVGRALLTGGVGTTARARRAVDETGAARAIAEAKIFGDREMGAECEFLVDDRDAPINPRLLFASLSALAHRSNARNLIVRQQQ